MLRSHPVGIPESIGRAAITDERRRSAGPLGLIMLFNKIEGHMHCTCLAQDFVMRIMIGRSEVGSGRGWPTFLVQRSTYLSCLLDHPTTGGHVISQLVCLITGVILTIVMDAGSY